MVTPEGSVVPLDVEDDIPYLMDDGVSYTTDPGQVYDLTGVRSVRGRILIDHHLSNATVVPDVSGPLDVLGGQAVPATSSADHGADHHDSGEESPSERPYCHDLTHLPASRDCHGCIVGKSREKRKFANKHKPDEAKRREPKSFGEIVTIDHLTVGDGIEARGVGGKSAMLTFFDLATNFRYAMPCADKFADSTFASLQYLSLIHI